MKNVDLFSFDDILILPNCTSRVKSRSQVNTIQKFYDGLDLRIPLISSSMGVFDTIEFCKQLSDWGTFHTISRKDTFFNRYNLAKECVYDKLNVGIAVSLSEINNNNDNIRELQSRGVIVSVDIANGAIIEETILDKLSLDIPVIFGNWGNPYASSYYPHFDMYDNVYMKYGIGPSAVCTTREKTGVGAPQGWLIQETSKRSKTKFISDGGITTPGDFCKAVALGADIIMSGRIFAGCKESNGDLIKISDKWYKKYYGMASEEVKNNKKDYIEGTIGYVLYEDKSASDILTEFEQGLRSSMSYCDSFTLTEYRSHADIVRVTSTTLKETYTRVIN